MHTEGSNKTFSRVLIVITGVRVSDNYNYYLKEVI